MENLAAELLANFPNYEFQKTGSATLVKVVSGWVSNANCGFCLCTNNESDQSEEPSIEILT